MIGLIPVSRDVALAFIAHVHRHHQPPQGYRFAVGAHDGTRLVGVATAGRPVARALDDGWTLEVTRVATDGAQHACSALYGACWRAAKALGYSSAITYTQAGESGASLRAAGWLLDAELPPRSGWDMPSPPARRPRHRQYGPNPVANPHRRPRLPTHGRDPDVAAGQPAALAARLRRSLTPNPSTKENDR